MRHDEPLAVRQRECCCQCCWWWWWEYTHWLLASVLEVISFKNLQTKAILIISRFHHEIISFLLSISFSFNYSHKILNEIYISTNFFMWCVCFLIKGNFLEYHIYNKSHLIYLLKIFHWILLMKIIFQCILYCKLFWHFS